MATTEADANSYQLVGRFMSPRGSADAGLLVLKGTLTTGTYLVQVHVGDNTLTRRVVLL